MKTLKIHFLNTIWSDSIILENNNHYAFVDTASSFYYPMIKEHLTKYQINHLDFILLTHFHTDHYGNIKNIINDFRVDRLYLKHYYGIEGSTSSGTLSCEEYLEKELATYNDIIKFALEKDIEIIYLDDLKKDNTQINFEGIILDLYDINNRLYEIYNDENSEFYKQKRFSENFNSIGTFLKVNNHNIFLGGDVTCSSTDIKELKSLSIKMIDKIYNKYNIDHIDIYKSCHHGGGGTNTLELCEKLKARYTIITNTARWLDNWNTYDNLKQAYEKVVILPTDFQKYIFTIDDKISYEVIKEDSLFITLKKN